MRNKGVTTEEFKVVCEKLEAELAADRFCAGYFRAMASLVVHLPSLAWRRVRHTFVLQVRIFLATENQERRHRGVTVIVDPFAHGSTAPAPELAAVRLAVTEDEESENADDDDWQREHARQAGMAGGCAAYNDAMGWGDGRGDE